MGVDIFVKFVEDTTVIMKPLIDVHNHTVASGHAFSTLQEMAAEASRQGLEYLGITDHGPTVAGIHRQCWTPETRAHCWRSCGFVRSSMFP